MGAEDRFLIGLDLVKDRARLESAYNDEHGITAAFNRNALKVINRRFGTDFEPEAFEHVAFWNPSEEWIEMRLRARRPVRVRMPNDPRPLLLETGDEIRTELSCKFTRRSLLLSLEGTGLGLEHWWSDPDHLFALALVRALRPEVVGPGGEEETSP